MSITLKTTIFTGEGFNYEEKDLSVEEATEMLKEGRTGRLMFSGTYRINKVDYFASSLAVGNDTFIFEEEGKLVIPTYFQKKYLRDVDGVGKVKVNVIIDPKKVENLGLRIYSRD